MSAAAQGSRACGACLVHRRGACPRRDALRPFREARSLAGIPGRAGKTPPFRRGPRGLRCVQRACSFTQGYGPRGRHASRCSLRAGPALPGHLTPVQRGTQPGRHSRGRAGKTPPFRRGPRGLRCVQRACSFTQGYGPKGGHTGHRSLRAGLASPGRAPPIQRDTGRAAVQRALPCASRTAVYGTRCGDCSMPLRGLPMQQYGSGTPPGGHSRRDRQSLPCRIAPHIPTLPGAGCRQRKARVQRARKLYCAPKCAILY